MFWSKYTIKYEDVKLVTKYTEHNQTPTYINEYGLFYVKRSGFYPVTDFGEKYKEYFNKDVVSPPYDLAVTMTDVGLTDSMVELQNRVVKKYGVSTYIDEHWDGSKKIKKLIQEKYDYNGEFDARKRT